MGLGIKKHVSRFRLRLQVFGPAELSPGLPEAGAPSSTEEPFSISAAPRIRFLGAAAG
jgi:hypothetical protein